MSTHVQHNIVRDRRVAKGWSQQELADRTALSRAGISAIESGRLAPSVHAALALAQALGCSVEELFGMATKSQTEIEWAFQPVTKQPRFWNARFGDRTLSYPVADDSIQLDWHDGILDSSKLDQADLEKSERTLVVAGCDPAAGLLAAEYARQYQFRMIILRRNSQAALELLAEGKAHVAGIHLGGAEDRSANRRAARSRVGKETELVHVATWEEGFAISPSLKNRSITSLSRGKSEWIGREVGSGARQVQDEVLGSRSAPKLIATDHRMVAAAIKCGWAEIGPCVRLASEEAGLDFVPLHTKRYDLCFRSETADDPRISALLATIRSPRYRSKLGELPGYGTHHTGEISS